MAQFQAFEETHPEHLAVKLLRMWRAAARAIQTDLETVALENLPQLFANAFSREDWSSLSPGFQYLAEIPDIPVELLAPMGFSASGRTILRRVATPLYDTLAERELPIRRVLALALHARIWWEIARGENGDYAQVEAAAPQSFKSWHRNFAEGFTAFLAELPDVCGEASKVVVPNAMRLILKTPDAFLKVHSDLIRFLRTQDFDEKARQGKALAALTEARAAETPAYVPLVDAASLAESVARLN